ncbi:MAG TPA: helix-turn-helix domain-containing protein [Arenimonas sp.]|nr:helix-turn-helix domain-containing protein [Arenimonas sp.]
MNAAELLIHALLALGLGQGLFLCLQLWRLRQRNPFGYGHLLIALGAVLAVLVEQWLVYAGLWRQWPHLLRATVWMPFLFGPGLWLFVVSLQRPRGRWRDSLHYLPALIGLGWFLPFLLQSGADKLAFVAGTHSIPLESSVFGLAKAVSLFAYVIAIRWRLRTTAAGGEDRLRRRFARASSAFLVFLTGLWLLFVAEHRWGDLGLPSDVVAALGLGVFFYAASLIAVAHWRDFALSLAPAAPTSAPEAQPVDKAAITAQSPREGLLDADSTATLFQHVVSEVRSRSLFREPALKIDDLAERLGLATHYLSYVINAESGQNVQAWLNSLRVEAAQQALRAAGDDSILDIGLAAGFNSKASFNRVFKAATGQSPSDYRAAHRAQIAN